MLRPLSLARLRIILLPRKARLLPALVHGVDQVLAKCRVYLRRAGLVWTFLLGDSLENVLVCSKGRM
jgi:hypothetical protein